MGRPVEQALQVDGSQERGGRPEGSHRAGQIVGIAGKATVPPASNVPAANRKGAEW